jgi:hypothetical protein
MCCDSQRTPRPLPAAASLPSNRLAVLVGAHDEYPVGLLDLLVHPLPPAFLDPGEILVDDGINAAVAQLVGEREHPGRVAVGFLGVADENAGRMVDHGKRVRATGWRGKGE